MSAVELQGELASTFSRLAQKSVKWSSYFAVYEALLASFRGKPDLVLVEIGVMNGASLFMWRSYFGDGARIIGIDYSPTAERMREKGFEIHIGDQASPEFWRRFFEEVGSVDIIIDDGGHTNRQQILTVDCCLEHVKDGGLILVEDVHTSYMKRYGNPSAYSFVNYAKGIVDRIQTRNPSVARERDAKFGSCVYSVSFFESVVCFHVDRQTCRCARRVEAGTEEIGAVNYWNVDKRLVGFQRGRKVREMIRGTVVAKVVVSLYSRMDELARRLQFARENRRLRRFFKKV